MGNFDFFWNKVIFRCTYKSKFEQVSRRHFHHMHIYRMYINFVWSFKQNDSDS